MNDIINSRSGRTEIDTYSPIVTTKYNINSAGKSAAIKYNRKDILRDPADSTLSYYMRTSSSRYKKCLKSKRRKKIYRQKKCLQNYQRKEERKLYTSRLLFIFMNIF